MGIPIFQKEGYEADDIIGTLASQACRKSKVNPPAGGQKSKVDEAIIVTGDRDALQLVSPKIKVYAPVKGMSEAQLLDEKGVEEKMAVSAQQIVDYKGLAGDASDNYPGVSGIGPKTAVVLIKRFGTLEKIYKNLPTVKKEFGESVWKKLVAGKEMAFLSKKLAKIVIEVPLKWELKKLEFNFTPQEKEKTLRLLKELGFRSLVGRLKGEQGQKLEAVKEKGEQLGLI
jgi:DNA polymerase-1